MVEAVERLVQQADGIRVGGIDEPDGLLAKNVLVEMAVEESIGDIQLLGGPAP